MRLMCTFIEIVTSNETRHSKAKNSYQIDYPHRLVLASTEGISPAHAKQLTVSRRNTALSKKD